MSSVFAYDPKSSPFRDTAKAGDPFRLEALDEVDVVQLSAGRNHSLAVDSSGNVYAWGHGAQGQLGIITEGFKAVSTPTRVNTLEDVRVAKVFAGDDTSACITVHGELYEWGFIHAGDNVTNARNMLALPGLAVETYRMSDKLKDLLRASTVMYLTGAESHQSTDENSAHLPVLDQQTIDAEAGILAQRTRRISSPYPTKSPFNIPVKLVALGYSHTIVLTNDGDVYGKGYNDRGQAMGNGTRINNFNFQRIEALQSDRIVSIAAGSSHSLAVTASGLGYAWGSNVLGALGVGMNLTDQLYPAQILLPDHDLVQVAAGSYHSIMLTKEGWVYSCGHAEYGQHGSTEAQRFATTASHYYFQPRLVHQFSPEGGKTSLISIQCGSQFQTGVDTQGNLWTWGYAGPGAATMAAASLLRMGRDPTEPIKLGGALSGLRILNVSAGHKHVLCLPEPIGDPTALSFEFILKELDQVVDGSKTSSSSEDSLKPKDHKWVKADVAKLATKSDQVFTHVHKSIVRARCPRLYQTLDEAGVFHLNVYCEPLVLNALREHLYLDQAWSCPPHRLVDLQDLATSLGLPQLARACARSRRARMVELHLSEEKKTTGSAGQETESIPSSFKKDLLDELERAQESAVGESTGLFYLQAGKVSPAEAEDERVESTPPPVGHTSFSWGIDSQQDPVPVGHTPFSFGRTATSSQAGLRKLDKLAVHACVLRRFPYFRGLLTSGFQERESALTGAPVTLRSITRKALHGIVTWMYAADPAVSVTEENCLELLACAREFELETLFQVALRFTVEHVDAENAAQLSRFAEMANLPRLSKECWRVLG